MKAAALTGPGRVELVDIAEPRCGPDEVVLRMLGVGLCGTDMDVVRGDRRAPRLPWVLGHEGVGEVVAVGRSVTGRRVGQRAAIEPNYCCRMCRACRRGFTSGCEDRVAVGLVTPGILAEYVAVPAEFAHPVADHVGIPELVCTEPLTVARSAIRRSGIAAGDTCLVVGAGSQGLFVCLSLIAEGITPLVREPHPGRRALALSLGARADDDVERVDHVVETSGASGVLEPVVERLRAGGRITLIGMSAAPLGLSPMLLVRGQLSVSGSLIYDHPGDFADTIAVLEGGKLPVERVLAARFSPHEAAAAFDAVAATPGKCWIGFDGAAA